MKTEFWKPYILKWSSLTTDFENTQYAGEITQGFARLNKMIEIINKNN